MECHKCLKKCGNNQQKAKKSGFWGWFQKNQELSAQEPEKFTQIALVGMPNVGKSALFNALTGTYVTVSNYPGTTVEVSRGKMFIDDISMAVVDTPGMYSLLPITEEEKVARDLLLQETINLAIHVIDAKNLGRMLPLTFQLMETGLPVLLAVNMMDEAEQLGIKINRKDLEKKLGIPVVTMAAALNLGIQELKERAWEYVKSEYVKSDNLSGAC